MEFKKATKEQAKLRAALFGPSGAGKTYTALRIASGMGHPIALIDTERGSASKYADRFEFDVLDLPDKSIATYVDAIGAAAKAKYPVLVIDSLSHAWQELLAEIDALAKAKYRGNTWSAWSDGTPKQRKMVDAILGYPGHVLCTMRSKTEWTEEKDERTGKVRPVRVGLTPEQGKGIEYEFDLLLELNVDHIATCLKDRTGKYQDKIMEKPGEGFGRDLVAWLSEGAAPRSVERPAEPEKREHHASWPTGKGRFFAKLADIGDSHGYDAVATFCERLGRPRPSQMDEAQRGRLLDHLASERGRAEFAAFLADGSIPNSGAAAK